MCGYNEVLMMWATLNNEAVDKRKLCVSNKHLVCWFLPLIWIRIEVAINF